ncbi:MAG TPA: Panacea domain-containing protein, partial [Acidovorax sp.]|nr:Panacea domain-containing protein [Acidovorax sp.]
MSGTFNERKAAQAAACLLHKAGGSLSVLKLMKLMYLAERRSLKKYGDTITGDAFVSMPHGPVLSMTYN